MKKFIIKGLLSVSLLGGIGTAVAYEPVAVSAQANRLGGTDTSLTSGSQSFDNLSEYVLDQVSDNTYITTTGDTVHGRDLLDASGNVYEGFNNLTEEEKQAFLGDVKTAAEEKRQRDIQNGVDTNPVTQNTVDNYWKALSRRDTVASRMIVLVTQDVRPDFVGASRFLSPFTPAVNVATAMFLILASFAFFLFLAVDIFYFNTPPLQYFLKEQGGSNVVVKVASSMVSERARTSLQETQGGKGNPFIKYFMRSWVHLLAFGAMLFFFSSGSMLTLVGPLLNLFSSFIGG